jgi:hypothetical protein
MSRTLAEEHRRRWTWALQAIASSYPKGSREYRLFGSLAWGRSDADPRPDERKEDVFFGHGYLEGFRAAALLHAEVLKLPTEDALRSIHRRMEERT